MKIRRVIVALVALASTSAHAAPPVKQCIATAESGQQLRRAGKLLAAYQEFASCTAMSCPPVVRRDCGRWLEEVDAATPTVGARLEDSSGNEVLSGVVLVDGQPLRSNGQSMPIDPGVHRFVWQRGDAGDVVQDVVVREGERNRVIVLRVPERPASTNFSREEGSSVPPRAPAAQERSAGRRTAGPLPWIVGGVGLGAAVVGVGLWTVGLNERGNLSDSCAATHACFDHDVDASRTKLIVGDVLVGIGVVAIVAGLYLALRREPSRPIPVGAPHAFEGARLATTTSSPFGLVMPSFSLP
jgi:hypothetical protein